MSLSIRILILATIAYSCRRSVEPSGFLTSYAAISLSTITLLQGVIQGVILRSPKCTTPRMGAADTLF
jgi:hypothetical protein